MILWLILGLIFLASLGAILYYGAGVIMVAPNKLDKDPVFPQLYGLKAENVSFKTSDDLTLKGWFIPSPKGDVKTLIMCHGWGDNKGHLLEKTHFLNSSAGFNLLYFDHRSHGSSEGEFTTMGYLERLDFEAALKFLKERHPKLTKHLGAFGLSMGGSVVLLSMPSHPEIKAAVIESAFPDYRRVVRRWAWNNMRIPYFPLVWMVLHVLRWRVGGKPDKYSSIKFIGKIAPRPLFLIGGSADTLMPEVDVRALFARAKKPKTLWIVPGATHGNCRKTSELEYDTRVTAFFQRHL